MKVLQIIVFSALIAVILCGCGRFRIAGGELPEVDSEYSLREKGEAVHLIKSVRNKKALPPETFYRLAKYSDRFIDRMLGENPTCPEDLLQKFAGSNDYYVRRGVAENPKAPRILLIKLSADPDSRVRDSLGKNPAIPEDLMRELADGNDVYSHGGLVRNPNISPDMLRQIYNRYKDNKERQDYFITVCSMYPRLPEDIAHDIYMKEKDKNVSDALERLAWNPAVPSSLLLEIYRNSKSRIKLSAYALNPNCPEEIKQVIRNSGDNTAKKYLKYTFPK